MSPDEAARALEPANRPGGRRRRTATGPGQSMVKRVIEASDGSIVVE
jgi:hypothetical protein